MLIYCGVNKGSTFRSLIPKHKYSYGFEASPGPCRKLRRMFADDLSVTIIHAALSAKHGGTIPFNVYSHSGSSSIGHLSPEHIARWEQATGKTLSIAKTVDVPAINLGYFCVGVGITYIDHLVTDLQGMDLEVLTSVHVLFGLENVGKIMCEVQKNDVDPSYPDLPDNKRARFESLLGATHKVVRENTRPEWKTVDIVWEPRKA